MRNGFADRLAIPSSRFVQLLTSVLAAVAILAASLLSAPVRGYQLPSPPSKQLPRKQVAKTRTIWTFAARACSKNGAPIRPHSLRRLALLSVVALTAADSSTFSPQRVFRPLRC